MDEIRKSIREIIADFQTMPLRNLTRRDMAIPVLPPGLNKVIALIGMRRTGKTCLLQQIYQDLQTTQGVGRSQIIYINFEDDRLEGVIADQLRLITDTHAEMFPEQAGGPRFLFLDEIQAVAGWELFVRRLVDQGDLRIYLTGSSSKMLSTEVASSLRGRGLSLEVSPFSFREYLRRLAIEIPERPDSKQTALLKNRFREYLIVGGFPETIGADEELRIRILQEYVLLAIHRDMVERHSIKNPEALKALIRILLEQASSLFSINKTYNGFKSQGRSVSKDSLYRFIDYIQDAFLLFPVEVFSASQNRRLVNPKKIYAVDPGLVTAFSWKYARNTGALLENAVYCELRGTYPQINYYRTKSGREVDFVGTGPTGRFRLFQVCADIGDPQTLARETAALWEALDEMGIAEGVVVTLDEERRMEQAGKQIRFLPAYAWFLDLEGRKTADL
ncbi:MAG TPA: ATP-binding protein [Syntrophales bacterium]|nr:ATP-binding protein [Syntrophales bacterium]HOG91868.1 ATP-binding protein [Smithella sp.]HPN09382.1 ATP-binding protein [Syntrophales bacterium]HPX82537.1 ATP-binding protein [Syntrophales bacterium]HQB14614.1 ATP-binding protein [Syntrophales bacterium]